MTTQKKILIGGLGALTPIIMNLLVVDLNILLVNLTLFAFIGYAIRVIVLFYLGGVIAYLHKDEKNQIKIFELGIVAPALITVLINAGNVDVPKIAHSAAGTNTSYHILVSSAYAQTDQPGQDLKTFSMPKESAIRQFWRGLTGASSKKVWFVVAGSHLKLDDAKKQAKDINDKKNDFKAEVYKPYGNDPHYRVVIGANLLISRAQLMRKRAIAEGLPKETHVWTFAK